MLASSFQIMKGKGLANVNTEWFFGTNEALQTSLQTLKGEAADTSQAQELHVEQRQSEDPRSLFKIPASMLVR